MPVRVAEAILAVSLTFWVYTPALCGGFELDDNLFLSSPQVTIPGDPWYLLKPGQPRPLTYLTFYWNYRASGLNPWGYHLVNLLLHSFSTLLIYILTLSFIRSGCDGTPPFQRWLPLASAAVFGLHPVQSEPVCYIYQRATLLAGCLGLAAMILYLRSTAVSRQRGVWRAAAAGSFVLALASKESALALVLVWGAWKCSGCGGTWTGLSWLRPRKWVWLALPAILLLSASVVAVMVRSFPALARESAGYAVAQARVVAIYVRMLIWPAGLSIDHDVRLSPVPLLGTVLSALLVLILVALAAYARRWNRSLSFLGVAFFLLLAPTSSFIPRDDLMFEHRLYLPMISFSILVPWAIAMAVTRIARQRETISATAWILVVAVSLAGAAFVTTTRARIWGNSIDLWTDAAEKAPRKARVRYNLAIAWLPVDRERARRELEETVRLSPDHAAALYNLGWLDQNSGRLDQARLYYERSLQADPLQWRAEQNLGNLALYAGRLADAERHFMGVVERMPDYIPALRSAATVQIQLGMLPEARQTLQRWRNREPDSLEARWLNAYLLSAEGRADEALEELRQIETLDSTATFRDRIRELRSSLRHP